MLLATFRSSVALISTFLFLLLTFMLLAIGEFTGSRKFSLGHYIRSDPNVFIIVGAHRAGGVLGCITAFLALYTGSAGLYSPDASYFVLPVGGLAKGD
jgi:succinate-acetate transporter protein